LPAVPHVTVAEPSPSIALAAEPAPAALVAELAADQDKPAPPLPPSPRKRIVNKRKPQATNSGPGAIVLPFTKKPSKAEVLTLLSNGKTQRQVAEHLGIGLRTVGRIVAASKTSQMASDLAAS
jgi:DNA-binding NarL/FixJ family response regulator